MSITVRHVLGMIIFQLVEDFLETAPPGLETSVHLLSFSSPALMTL